MTENILGNIHSIESCGTVDGPGIRFVVFTQGCPMRCKYCHNPDSWGINLGQKISVSEILRRYDGVKEFCRGGITVTGGEPLLQIDFVIQLFKAAKEKKIHTALDTSGITYNPNDTRKLDEVLKYTDLVLLDIKHIDDAEHINLTGHSNKNILAFAKYLSEIKKPMWVRHVVVPEITYKQEYLFELGKFLKGLKNVTALDVLPYHVMGIQKYKNLGLNYPLDGIPPLTKEQALQARTWIMEGYKFKE
ncbi:MAG: pyruvate formate lyase-activating protein [Cyanobacteria bacterium SIG26]|nr:pyruvate formate lyase-activating protein [Cyanobacteria bacterium SIG26]